MRSREMTARPARSLRRGSAKAGRGAGGECAGGRNDALPAPQLSTFRRVAVFVPFDASGTPG
jgi:hypothetical protein